jgi:hypothetical protein
MNDSMAFVALSDAEGAVIVGGGPLAIIITAVAIHVINNMGDFVSGFGAGFRAGSG